MGKSFVFLGKCMFIIFPTEVHINLTNFMFGKNVMGGYADKLSYEERWQVIHYIRLLQADELNMEYSEAANTLNPAFGTPFSSIAQMAIHQEEDHAMEADHGEEGEAQDEHGDTSHDEEHH